MCSQYTLGWLPGSTRHSFSLSPQLDCWEIEDRRIHWPQSHSDVVSNGPLEKCVNVEYLVERLRPALPMQAQIQKLLRKARKGTEIVYVPGNHDEACRSLLSEWCVTTPAGFTPLRNASAAKIDTPVHCAGQCSCLAITSG